ncbi:unnamed protein product [Choristocarpus tenellus]
MGHLPPVISPSPPPPVVLDSPYHTGSYTICTRVDDLLYVSGHIPMKPDGVLMRGRVGEDVDVEEAKKAARLTTVNMLATLKKEIGDLDRVKKVVKLLGFVNCVDGFGGQPSIINGASDLLVEVFGEKGVHARSAVGSNRLPLNIQVELEAVVEVEPLEGH